MTISELNNELANLDSDIRHMMVVCKTFPTAWNKARLGKLVKEEQKLEAKLLRAKRSA